MSQVQMSGGKGVEGGATTRESFQIRDAPSSVAEVLAVRSLKRAGEAGGPCAAGHGGGSPFSNKAGLT